MTDPLKVLIVDDSLLAEHALKSYFEKLGHDVVGLAKNAEKGKEMFEGLSPDVVTVDAVMPGMSGQDFIKYINQKETSKTNKPKILMISSDDIPSSDKSEMRVDKYLLKPITLAKIQQTLDELF